MDRLNLTNDPIQLVEAVDGGTLLIPGGGWLLSATFTRQGGDLLLVGNDLVFSYWEEETDAEFTLTMTDHLNGSALYQIGVIEHDSFDFYNVATTLSGSSLTEDTAFAGFDTQDNTIVAGSGDDIIFGNTGNDTLTGNDGDDWFIGGGGNDDITGGNHGSEGDTVSFHNAEVDLVIDLSTNSATGEGTDILTGIENVEAGSGNDQITGDAADNVLNGLEGDDELTGGVGADTLIGGEGSDVFIFASGDSGTTAATRDSIEDFDATGADTIDISAFAIGTFSYIGSADFTVNTNNTQARFDANARILEIDADGDSNADMEIQMDNVNNSELDENDFITSGGG